MPKARRIVVIKLGSNVLTDEDGALDLNMIRHIVQEVVNLKNQGAKVIMVSSGAVAAGKTVYKLTNTKRKTTQRQVYSAIGQVQLMSLYSDLFMKHGLVCAQVLATKEDFTGVEHYKTMKSCLSGLLRDDIVPIVNENDVVSLDELMFTDNDELAGLTAFMLKATTLIILTSVNGLYRGHPDDPGSELIEVIGPDDHWARKYVKKKTSSAGRGGMVSKYDTAVKAAEKGITVILANGKNKNTLSDIYSGRKIGTKFLPRTLKIQQYI